MSDERQQIEQRSRRSVPGPTLRRLLAVVGGVGLSVFFSGPALAGSSHVQPTITSTEATFAVPAGDAVNWRLRLWSDGTLEGTTAGTSGTLVVFVPPLKVCSFQADVTTTPRGERPHYYSGTRATMTQCGPTIAGHIYLCTPTGSPTTTEVAGGTLAATGPQTVASQANPLAPTAVASGSYSMTAGSPTGDLLVVCGGSATIGSGGLTASESVTVPPGGTGVDIFYASAPPVGAGGGFAPSTPIAGGTSSATSSNTPSTPVAGATAAGGSSPVPPISAASSQLAFTGMNPGPPLLLGLTLIGLGALMVAFSGRRRHPELALRIRARRAGRSAE